MKPRLGRALALTLSAALYSGFAPQAAFAQAPTSDAAKAEARDRFDRGLKLFNDGDNAGALAEFKRAYELIPNALVLFNIGLTYAAMGRPADAVDALDKVIKEPGSLSGERLARAKQARDEQAQRVANLTVVTNVPASIEVDNIEAGKTPLDHPLRISSGSHIIGAVAPGYAPSRKEVTIAGGQKAELKVDLVQMEGKAAHLTVKTHLPDASVVIDDQVVGKTPLSQSLTVAPGQHKIELKRPGYVTARQDMLLGDGASGEVSADPEEDKSATAEMGQLELDITETQGVVTIDGKQRGVYTGSYRLPRGAHHVLIERGDFLALERDVTVDAGRTTTARIVLEPTPEYRAHYVSSASSQRTWGWILAATGVVAGGVGGYLWKTNWSTESDKKSTYDAANAEFSQATTFGGGGRCDNKSANDTKPENLDYCKALPGQVDSALTDYNSAKKMHWVGPAVAGVGAASLVTGIILLASSNDPHRYDKKSTGETLGGVRALPVAWSLPGGGVVGLAGTF